MAKIILLLTHYIQAQCLKTVKFLSYTANIKKKSLFLNDKYLCRALQSQVRENNFEISSKKKSLKNVYICIIQRTL